MRDLAHRRMLRAGALAGYESAAAAVAAGFSADESNPRSLIALGLCALDAGELALASRALVEASRLWSSGVTNQASPYQAVLAHYHHARVLERLGDHARARAEYDVFLDYWGRADRPVAEVTAARAARG